MRFDVRHAIVGTAAVLAAMALVGCGSGESESKGPAQGNQILEGSISDEMIAYDTLRSEPPLAKPAEGEGGAAAGSARGESGDASAPTAEPEAGAASAAQTDTDTDTDAGD